MTQFESSTLATPEAISDLTERVMAFLNEQGVDARAAHHTALVLNEVLTNLGTHGDTRERPAKIAVIVNSDKVTGQIVDTGPAFDPTLAADPSLDVPASERPIGGLGLYLVKKLSLALEYARRGDENCMTFAIGRKEGARNQSAG